MTVLETERLLLCRLSPGDAEFILGLLNKPSFLRYIGDKGVRTPADTRKYLRDGPLLSYARHGFGLYLTKLRDGGVPIGICGLLKRESLEDVDIGFAFLPCHWSQGYATEAAAATLAYGKATLGLRRIVAVTQPGHVASIRVLEKIGLHFERTVRLSACGEDLSLFAVDF